MKYNTNYEGLLKDGFSQKFADYYLNLIEKEKKNPYYDTEYVNWAHDNGFLAESAYAYDLTPNTIDKYLSDYEYYKMWPINNWTRIWVDDKMTLKQMLSNNDCENYMPKYYFYVYQTTKHEMIIYALSDAKKINTFDNFLYTLKCVKSFACKPCNGTASQGFYMMKYEDDKYFINKTQVTETDIFNFINTHPNYLFTEYIYPAPCFASISPTIHTLRVMVQNIAHAPKILGGYLRFSGNNNSDANYIIIDDKNPLDYNVFVNVDFDKGTYGSAKLTYINRTENVDEHPITKVSLYGELPEMENLKQLIYRVCAKFSTIEYMGFDIGYTRDGYKIMEINTHPGIKYIQIFQPIFNNELMSDFYKKYSKDGRKTIQNDI